METCGGAFLLSGDRVLLGLRASHKTYAGCWDLIGGHVEAGESPSVALSRELREEIGITPTAWAFAERFQFAEGGAVSELLVFEVTDWSGEPALSNDEHVELQWHPLSEAAELESLAVDEYRPIFRRMKKAATPQL